MSGGTPVAGDWNGSGKTEIGMYKNGTWWLDTNEDGTLDAGDAVLSFGFSGNNVIPVVGDWNGGGKSEVGIYSGGAWFRDYDGSHTWDATNQAALAYLGWAPTGSQQIIPVDRRLERRRTGPDGRLLPRRLVLQLRRVQASQGNG